MVVLEEEIAMVWITAEDVKKQVAATGRHWYKYVRMCGGGLFRFVHIAKGISHAGMVEEDESAASAGLVVVHSTGFHFEAYGSDTLGVTWDNQDEERLTEALGRPYTLKY
jgi:hypothetical protein